MAYVATHAKILDALNRPDEAAAVRDRFGLPTPATQPATPATQPAAPTTLPAGTTGPTSGS